MNRQIALCIRMIVTTALVVLSACAPGSVEVPPLPSAEGSLPAAATPTGAPIASLPTPTPQTSGGTCQFNSNGDLISGWYWLRDAAYAAYGEWHCNGLAADRDVAVSLQTLVTDTASGGAGYSSPVKLTYTNPTRDASESVQIYLQNPLPEQTATNGRGVGYQTTGYLIIPRSYVGDGGALYIRIERFKPNTPHVAVNAQTVSFDPPQPAALFRPSDTDEISGWHWLRDIAYAASGEWVFDGLQPDAPCILTLNVLVTHQANGGSGYSSPVEITLVDPANGASQSLSHVQVQNLLFTQDPANSRGYGYQTYGSIALDTAYVSADGQLIVRVKRLPGAEHHLAVNQNTLGIIQPDASEPPLTIDSPTPPMATGFEVIAQPPQGKNLFVEVWSRVDGTGNLPMLAIDFPMYRFDPKAGTLAPFGGGPGFTLTSSDWGFIGHGESRTGAAGTGAASNLSAISTLPCSIDVALYTGELDASSQMPEPARRKATVMLRAVTADGTLLAAVDGEQVTLAPGQSWSHQVEVEATSGEYNGRYIITSTFTNYGWQDRNLIVRSE